jgi:LytR cell envelope-related transcriptional attenuator
MVAAGLAVVALVAIVRAAAWPGGDEQPVVGPPAVTGCSVSEQVLQTVPILRRPPGEPVPEAALSPIGDVWTPLPEHARPAGRAGDASFWVVPVMRLGEGEQCAPAGDACLVAYGGRTFKPVCTSSYSSPEVLPYRGRVLAYGIVGADVSEVELWVDGGGGVVPAHEGVIAALLPEGVSMSRRSGVHIRSFGGSRPTLAVLNATRASGLATDVGERLQDAGVVRSGDLMIGNFNHQDRARSTVFYDGETFRERARSIARMFGISDVRPGPTAVLELARGAPVVVVLGSDAAR